MRSATRIPAIWVVGTSSRTMASKRPVMSAADRSSCAINLLRMSVEFILVILSEYCELRNTYTLLNPAIGGAAEPHLTGSEKYIRIAHYFSRKFLRSSLPPSVANDSGWNWMPSIWYSVCRKPIISFESSERAVTTSSFGKLLSSATSE